MTTFLLAVSVLETFGAFVNCVKGDMAEAVYMMELAIFNVLIASVTDERKETKR